MIHEISFITQKKTSYQKPQISRSQQYFISCNMHTDFLKEMLANQIRVLI